MCISLSEKGGGSNESDSEAVQPQLQAEPHVEAQVEHQPQGSQANKGVATVGISSQTAGVSEESGESKPYNPIQPNEAVVILANIFDTDKETVHSCYRCPAKCCVHISRAEAARLASKKFRHEWLFQGKNWWLCYVEGQGMYCLVCRAHDMKNPRNKQEKFSREPSVRFKIDALESHVQSRIHRDAITTHLVQNVSIFHTEELERREVDTTVLEKAFSTAYFLMKRFIPNSNFLPLIEVMEQSIGQTDLKYFQHRSQGSSREIFLTIGETMKEQILEKVRDSGPYGLMTDEATDISVKALTFIQFFDGSSGKIETAFLSVQDVLEKHDGANSVAIFETLMHELEASNLDVRHMMGFASDGATVMTGKNNGVAARLKALNERLVSVHCVCHRLALACTDTLDALAYIKKVQEILRQLWKLFENSPKNTACLAKVQLQLKNMQQLSSHASKKITKKLQKACQTRWLSFDKAVQAVHENFEPVLQTLNILDKDFGNPTACGLLKKMHSTKFLGTIYVLKEVLPILSKLSTTFQRDRLDFSIMVPMVSLTKAKLSDVGGAPVEALKRDMESFTQMSAELTLTDHQENEMNNLGRKYVAALLQNLDRRFAAASDVLDALAVLNPTAVPPASDAAFKLHGKNSITTLAEFYYKDLTEENKKVKTEQLHAEWEHMKHMIDEKLRQRAASQQEVPPTTWFIAELLRQRASFKPFFPELLKITQIAACIPVSNAWPERGASALKSVKTRLRSRLTNSMLEAILQVCINGPPVSSSKEVVQAAVKKWKGKKKRCKLGHSSTAATEDVHQAASQQETDRPLMEEVGIQTTMTVHEEVRAAAEVLDLSDSDSDTEED